MEVLHIRTSYPTNETIGKITRNTENAKITTLHVANEMTIYPVSQNLWLIAYNSKTMSKLIIIHMGCRTYASVSQQVWPLIDSKLGKQHSKKQIAQTCNKSNQKSNKRKGD